MIQLHEIERISFGSRSLDNMFDRGQGRDRALDLRLHALAQRRRQFSHSDQCLTQGAVAIEQLI